MTRGHYTKECAISKGGGEDVMRDNFRRFEQYARDGFLTKKRFRQPGFGFYWSLRPIREDYEKLVAMDPVEAWKKVHPTRKLPFY
jgi:hypothetical protein